MNPKLIRTHNYNPPLRVTFHLSYNEKNGAKFQERTNNFFLDPQIRIHSMVNSLDTYGYTIVKYYT